MKEWIDGSTAQWWGDDFPPPKRTWWQRVKNEWYRFIHWLKYGDL